ncbi:hypothetical protein BDZ94DRAFT_1006167 [Collybia nuda]|uniref:Nucleoporin Nup37 n=1 Tax=Collybia nuda TaxID=64659 RepID=A0A9P5XYT5_9AGAR|nr:hypothetical protein BDZ94DRAFT_1006167 [Collybia nuda]
MDIQHNQTTQVYVLRACYNDDATDLLAIGGEHSVDVLLVTDTLCQTLASFHVGSRITALAWSSVTISPTSSDDWIIELTAAGSDFGLHLLTKSSMIDEHIFPFGGGLSGHHGKVTDMVFCGGRGEDSARYVATVSDDKMMMVWDLHPTIMSSNQPPTPSLSARPQPTAYVIAFPRPLSTISSHPSTSKEFLISDCHGSIYITDWRSDPQDTDPNNWRHSSLVELTEPYALSGSSLVGLSAHCIGSAAWHRDTTDIVGAVYGSRFSIWDISTLRGGKPFTSGVSFSEGGNHFRSIRWCQTYPDYFAISAQSPETGAVLHVHNTNYTHTAPTVFNLRPKPFLVRDFDFLAMRGVPRIAAAVGKTVFIFTIGADA